jgi:hypothetical protein
MLAELGVSDLKWFCAALTDLHVDKAGEHHQAQPEEDRFVGLFHFVAS